MEELYQPQSEIEASHMKETDIFFKGFLIYGGIAAFKAPSFERPNYVEARPRSTLETQTETEPAQTTKGGVDPVNKGKAGVELSKEAAKKAQVAKQHEWILLQRQKVEK